MSVFMIIDIKINDSVMYEKYVEKVKPVLKKYKGDYVVQTNNIISLSGNWNPERIVIIKFPSEFKMRECFGSEEYKSIAGLRINSTQSKTILVKEQKE